MSQNLQPLRNYAGSWRSSDVQDCADVINPATSEKLARVPLGTKKDVDAAVQAAASAFPAWRRTPAEERIQYLFKLKQLLEAHLDELYARDGPRGSGVPPSPRVTRRSATSAERKTTGAWRSANSGAPSS